MLHALTGETGFVDNLDMLQKRQGKGEKITMGYALTKLMEKGRKEGKEEGIKEGEERCAKAFVAESVMQKQPEEYILNMLRTCFRMKEEEAASLYRECEGAGTY